MQCFQCDEDATQECPRCGALYCDQHGDAICERCMDPALALPSYRVYRGSIGALLIGSIVAVWLLVLPPAGADQDGPPAALAGVVQTATVTATPEATAGASATVTPGETGTPTATSTPSATPTSTPTPESDTVTYIVQSGDTLFSIAAQYETDGPAIDALAAAIAQANGITNPQSIQVGQELEIPR
ncbi:MAG: LysM peptidoglycan-binding domain-containing protein [Dehalococcoidia bacterium]|nr:LysM peptidoglycan-binding domain-containing protein [Dehalococcoidia bacterium]